MKDPPKNAPVHITRAQMDALQEHMQHADKETIRVYRSSIPRVLILDYYMSGKPADPKFWILPDGTEARGTSEAASMLGEARTANA